MQKPPTWTVMADERRVTDRRVQPRGGRRITDISTHKHAHVTLRELGEYLDVNRTTILKWIQVGLLPAYRFPTVCDDLTMSNEGEWRIKTEDAVVFIARYLTRPAAKALPRNRQ